MDERSRRAGIDQRILDLIHEQISHAVHHYPSPVVEASDKTACGYQLLNDVVAAKTLGLTAYALRRMRREGRGPKWIRVGRLCRYSRDALAEYIEQNTVPTDNPMPVKSRRGSRAGSK